jgi:hypothetical protein
MERLDGKIFLGDFADDTDGQIAAQEDSERPWDEGVASQIDAQVSDGTLYERVLLRTKDPTTPPHTRTKCVKKMHYPGGWTCIGWKMEFQWFWFEAKLIVSTKTSVDIQKAVEDCLKQGAIAAAIAAIVSGGSARLQRQPLRRALRVSSQVNC